MEKFIVKENQNNLRLDKVLVAFMIGKSRSYISKLIDEGHVFVNGKIAKQSLKVNENDEIGVEIPENKTLNVTSEDPETPSICEGC